MRRPQPPRPLEIFEIALERLEDIRPLMQPATVREFSIAISDIVRQYIEAQMKITATHRTTEEFLHDLLELPNAALAAHRNLLADSCSNAIWPNSPAWACRMQHHGVAALERARLRDRNIQARGAAAACADCATRAGDAGLRP